MRNSKQMYAIHPSVAYQRRVIENMESKTGRSIQDWADLVMAEGPPESKERRSWLKSFYDIGGTTTALIVSFMEGSNPENFDGEAYLNTAVNYVDAMYSGRKARLTPIHDALVDIAAALGEDVRISPCRTIVPVYRVHVIAQIKPTTQTRIDLGFALKGCSEPLSNRLIDTGGIEKGDRVTHRIPLFDIADIDEEIRHWMRIAYELDS